MKKLTKYFIPLILSVLVLGAGLVLFFVSNPDNSSLRYELVKPSSRVTVDNSTTPRTYNHHQYISLYFYNPDETMNNVEFIVSYTDSSGGLRTGKFTVSTIENGKSYVENKIYDTIPTTNYYTTIKTKKIHEIKYSIKGETTEPVVLKEYETTTGGKAASYLLFAGGGLATAVFAVLLVYEKISPFSKSSKKHATVKAKVVYVEEEEEEPTVTVVKRKSKSTKDEKTDKEIEKLKLENEKLKLEKEILEKSNEKIVCKYCGKKVSAKLDTCPGCKSPLK